MNVTLRQLRAFVEVVRCGGFTAASKKLYLTQSATSLVVRELEAQLGLQLLDRSTRRLSMTEAGSEFLQSAERILADVELAVTNAQDLVEMRRGRITVATTPVLGATLLPEVIAQFQQSHPAIMVRMLDLPIEQIVHQVLSGEADFGVGVFPSLDVELDRIPLLVHSMGALVPIEWPLAKRRRELTWADLAEQPLIVMARSSGYRTLVDPFLHEAGINVQPRFEVHYLWSAIGLAEAGLGITVVPAYASLLVRSNRVRLRVLHDPLVQRKIEFVTRPGRSLSPAALAFRECLEKRCASLQA